jgi:hypothetical protein
LSTTAAPHASRSASYDFDDIDEAIEYCYSQGWTDGLPILLPTERRVNAILSATSRGAQEVVGRIPPKGGTATIEKIAINAAMAGCLPELFPVVLAAIEAMLAPDFNLNGVQATTHVCAPLSIVSGPIVRRLGFNSKDGVFGGGSRANAALGRAVRLVLWNIGGGIPGEIDKSTFGHPGKYAFCIAEDPDNNPWEPFHQSRDAGLSADDSAVTMFACEANRNVADTHNDTPHGLLDLIADALRTIGNENTYGGGQALVVLGPERARVMKQYGWTRKDVQYYLFDQARRSVRDIKRAKLIRTTPHWVDQTDPDALWPVFEQPDDILVTVAGGDGPHSSTCSGWGEFGGFAITRKIQAQ